MLLDMDRERTASARLQKELDALTAASHRYAQLTSIGKSSMCYSKRWGIVVKKMVNWRVLCKSSPQAWTTLVWRQNKHKSK